MLRMLLSVSLGATGLYLGWAGHGIWKDSPDELWAIVTINCVLWALAIAFEPVRRCCGDARRDPSARTPRACDRGGPPTAV